MLYTNQFLSLFVNNDFYIFVCFYTKVHLLILFLTFTFHSEGEKKIFDQFLTVTQSEQNDKVFLFKHGPFSYDTMYQWINEKELSIKVYDA